MRNFVFKSEVGSFVFLLSGVSDFLNVLLLMTDVIFVLRLWCGLFFLLDRVPSINFDQDKTRASMQRIADLLVREKAQLWINHDKAQRDTLKMAPAYYE